MSKDIEALIERLEKATGADRELDAAICIGLQYGGANSDGATNVRTDPEWGDDNDLLFEIGAEECCNPIPDLTASIDAALALCERMLPGSLVSLIQMPARWQVSLLQVDPEHPDMVVEDWTEEGETAPLAILLALLRSLNQEESRSEESKINSERTDG